MGCAVRHKSGSKASTRRSQRVKVPTTRRRTRGHNVAPSRHRRVTRRAPHVVEQHRPLREELDVPTTRRQLYPSRKNTHLQKDSYSLLKTAVARQGSSATLAETGGKRSMFPFLAFPKRRSRVQGASATLAALPFCTPRYVALLTETGDKRGKFPFLAFPKRRSRAKGTSATFAALPFYFAKHVGNLCSHTFLRSKARRQTLQPYLSARQGRSATLAETGDKRSKFPSLSFSATHSRAIITSATFVPLRFCAARRCVCLSERHRCGRLEDGLRRRNGTARDESGTRRQAWQASFPCILSNTLTCQNHVGGFCFPTLLRCKALRLPGREA